MSRHLSLTSPISPEFPISLAASKPGDSSCFTIAFVQNTAGSEVTVYRTPISPDFQKETEQSKFDVSFTARGQNWSGMRSLHFLRPSARSIGRIIAKELERHIEPYQSSRHFRNESQRVFSYGGINGFPTEFRFFYEEDNLAVLYLFRTDRLVAPAKEHGQAIAESIQHASQVPRVDFFFPSSVRPDYLAITGEDRGKITYKF